jgi:hypothetical protein
VKAEATQRGWDLAAIRAATPLSPANTAAGAAAPGAPGGVPGAAASGLPPLSVAAVEDVVAAPAAAKGRAPPQTPHTRVAGVELPGAVSVEDGPDSDDDEDEEEEEAPLLFVSEGPAPARGGVSSGRLSVVRVDDIASLLGRSSAGGATGAVSAAGGSDAVRRPSHSGRLPSAMAVGGEVRQRRVGAGEVVMGGLRTVTERESEGTGRSSMEGVEEVEL